MTGIPDDVMAAAKTQLGKPVDGAADFIEVVTIYIARAILAERERCVAIATERKKLYEQKRDKRSILEDDSLTQHEMFAHTAEAHEWLLDALRANGGVE